MMHGESEITRRRLIENYLDHELSPADRPEFERFHRDDASFRAEIEQYEALYRALALLPQYTVPLGFDAPILAAVLPRPAYDAEMLRMAGRLYGILAAGLAAVVAGLFLAAAGRTGSYQGAAASWLTEAVASVRGFFDLVGGAAGLTLHAAVDALAPTLSAIRPVASGLETAADAVAPHVAPIVMLAVVVSSLILLWAREPRRGVPHAPRF